MSQVDIHTLAGAYALDALSEIERAAFARHVAGCEACAVEVAELGETAARLGAAVSAPPPARLREAVLSQVARTRQVGPGSRPERPGTGRTVGAARRPGARSGRLAAAVAAAFVALAAIGGVWVVQERRLDEARAQAQVLQDARARVAAIEAAGDRQVRTAGVSGGGSVTVTLSHDLDDGVVVVADLPTPPAGEVYQLWRITGGTARSIGILGEGQRGGIAFLGAVGDADTVGVTLEPVGGSTTPTLPVVSAVPL